MRICSKVAKSNPASFILEAQDCPDHEHRNGHEVRDVPVLLEPHFDFLAEFARFRHEDLKVNPKEQ